MPSGAKAAIKQNVAKSTIQHVGNPRKTSVISGAATALRGGVGPVKQDFPRLPSKVNA